jgi:hypothetical protein
MPSFRRIAAALLLGSCAALPATADEPAAVAEAKAVADNLARQLGATLKETLQGRGPAAAIGVCKDTAPALAAELSRSTGWRVTRVSLRPRDPLLGSADPWEQVAMLDIERRLGRGEPVESLTRAEIVDEPQGKFLRYLKPLPTQELCLTCHGPQEGMVEPVKSSLAKIYPRDAATGYSVGRLRGAISVKRPL